MLATATTFKVLRLVRGEWVYCGEYAADSPRAAARAARTTYPAERFFRARPAALPREPWRGFEVG